ncbi:MAG TPA: mechanosensitive ion channel [Alphaproteobacteria bacterium]|nr:mechanosensitive ion channel [Alphaproteobacteria bacterium]
MDAETVTSASQEAVDTAVALVSNWGLQVIGAIALLIIGRWVAGMVGRSVHRSLEKAKVDSVLVQFFSGLAHYVVFAVVIIAVLSLFGIETTSLVAVLATAGLAIGLALQGTLSNFAAGVMLLIFRPFKIGDYVEVGGTAGSVAEVGLFSSVLNTPDNVRIMVPNSAIFGQTIKNYSANENRRIDLVVGVSYGDDLGQAMKILNDVIAKEPRVLAEPAPTVAVAELGDSSVNFVVRPWVKGTEYWPTRFDLVRNIKEQLEAGGCSIPFPQRDIHVIEVPASSAH